MKKLPVYFDSLIIIEPFHTSTANEQFNTFHSRQPQNEESILNRWTSALGDYLVAYYMVESIVEFDFDKPLYMICPEREMLGNNNRLAQIAVGIDSNNQDAFDFLKSELKITGFNHPGQYVEHIKNLSVPDAETLIIKFHTSGLRAKLRQAATDQQLQFYFDIMLAHHKNPVKREIFALILINQERFAQIKELNSFSQGINSVTGSSEFEWQSFIDVTKVKQGNLALNMGIPKEYAVIRTIEKDNIRVFDNLTFMDLVSFRTGNYMNEIRELFRTSNIQLATAKIEDFESICQKLEQEFSLALNEASDQIEKDEKTLRKKFNISLGTFVAGTTLGFSTSLLPALEKFGLTENIISALVGSASMLDLINQHVANKKRNKNLAFRPITVFMRSIKR